MNVVNNTLRWARIGALALGPALGLAAVTPAPAVAQVAIGVSVNVVPPILPVYVQPALPGPGYIWTPGYWAWDSVAADYYWVPGAWVLPPRAGLLWTPGYWGWANGAYLFHGGYWGPTVGFYGGVNYGFGYGGVGFAGGQWRGGQFFYNSSVTNVRNVNVTNVYNKTVIVNNNTHTSFNGGPNGISAKPTPAQEAAAAQAHVQPTAAQTQHAAAAKADPQARFSANQGKPANAAAEKPLGGAPAGEGGAHALTPAAHEARPVETARPQAEPAGHMEPQQAPMHARPAFAGPRPGPMGGPGMGRPMAMRPMPHPGGGGGGCRGPHCR